MAYNFKGKKNLAPVTQVGRIIEHLEEFTSRNMLTPGLAKSVISTESLRDDQVTSLTMVGNDLSTAIESIAAEMGLEKLLTAAQIEAGTYAGLMSGDYRSALASKIDFPNISTEGMAVVQSFGLTDSVNERSYSLEAYDERDNKNAAVYSIAYNMQAARQDEFGETFYPTIVVAPDNVGFTITTTLMMVFDGITRKVSGDIADFKKKNIIRAIANPTILRKDQTKVVPVYRAQAADKFVAADVAVAHNFDLEGETISTCPLVVGKKLDLLALSQTDTLLASGAMDNTDSLDPAISLQYVYVKIGADILKINVSNLPLANFTYNTQNNYRTMVLNFATTSVLLNKNTLQADGSALVTLKSIKDNDLILRLELTLTGNTNIETGETAVYGNSISAYSFQDQNGDALDAGAAPCAALATAINAGVIRGYDVLAYRSNLNRRQRGQLIDTTKFSQLYNVALRSPISAIHPINTDSQVDSSDIQSLIVATHIRVSNEAVTSLINTAQFLREYIDARDDTSAGPDMLGISRFFVRPTYFEETINMATTIDSIKSSDRAADIQAVLVNKVRDYAYRMYRDSEYMAAANTLAGGIAPMPVVIIGTDPVIARYLQVEGDLRTLSGQFDVRIVSTLDQRVAGKIFISFGVFDETRNVAPNPLNFGNLAWSPELVLTANISRGGTTSKETVVQPRYLFVPHLPIMTLLEIDGIPAVFNKVPINTHTV